jgi:hypothetical protein
VGEAEPDHKARLASDRVVHDGGEDAPARTPQPPEGGKGRLVQAHGRDAGRQAVVDAPLHGAERKRRAHALLQVADSTGNQPCWSSGARRRRGEPPT